MCQHFLSISCNKGTTQLTLLQCLHRAANAIKGTKPSCRHLRNNLAWSRFCACSNTARWLCVPSHMHAGFHESLNSALGIVNGGMDCGRRSNPSRWLGDWLSYFGCHSNIPICSKQEITWNLRQSKLEGGKNVFNVIISLFIHYWWWKTRIKKKNKIQTR